MNEFKESREKFDIIMLNNIVEYMENCISPLKYLLLRRPKK